MKMKIIILLIVGMRVASAAPLERFLAWFEGDLQTNYQTNREVAEAKLSGLQAPALSDSDEYLEYLSLLDASGRTGEAEKKIKEYLKKFPQDKRGVFLLAVHSHRVQKKELATYFFAQLEKDNSFVWKSLLYNNLGMIALQDKNKEQAISYFEKATTAEPKTAAPHVNLGAIYLQARNYSSAEKFFRSAVGIDSEFEDAALGLGLCLEGQGKFEEAHKVYSDMLAANTESLSVLYNDAILLGNRLNRKEEASQLMLRYVQRGGKEAARAQQIIQSWR